MEVIDMDGLHAANLAQWKSDLDNKEKENDELRLEIENLKVLTISTKGLVFKKN